MKRFRLVVDFLMMNLGRNAQVVKLVDTLASGASLRKRLGVRVSPAALKFDVMEQ